MINDIEIFDGKKFSDLLRDIHTKCETKEQQIIILIKELKPYIKNIGDAGVIVPLIKEYMEISVRNDENLVKMVAIVQRAISSSLNTKAITNGDYEQVLSEEEKKQIMEEVKKLDIETKKEIPKLSPKKQIDDDLEIQKLISKDGIQNNKK